jgi:SAM-dependent methyltransferase
MRRVFTAFAALFLERNESDTIDNPEARIMANVETLVDKHYGFGGIMEKIEAGLHLAGKDVGSLKVDDLSPIDEFHTRGRESTLEVAALAGLKVNERVLDVGCGLGGTARHLAEQYQCKVNGIDLTQEYVSVGMRLTELVGMSDQVALRQGSALDIPFEEGTFDVVWTEHVQMNIADKHRFYSEMARVLKPGGRLLFHDIFRGDGEAPVYPAPWAEDESISSLATESEARATMEAVGLEIVHWIRKVDESMAFFKAVAERIAADGPPPIGIHLLMGDNAKLKLQNYVQNLGEGRTSVAMGMARKA